MKQPTKAQLERLHKAFAEMLSQVKPVPCSPAIYAWWQSTALPMLKDQALSELQRNDEMPARIVGLMEGGDIGVINLTEAMGGSWGDDYSKDVTAHVHRVAALVPHTKASVFISEAWRRLMPKGTKREDIPARLENDPEREECVVFSMLHYEDGTMMQLYTMVEVLKVLGVDRSRDAWSNTKFGKQNTVDPSDGDLGGRFVFGSKEDK